MRNATLSLVECSCSTHAVTVRSSEGDVELALWTHGPAVDTFRHRIRTAWAALRGRLNADHVILTADEANRLATAISAATRLAEELYPELNRVPEREALIRRMAGMGRITTGAPHAPLNGSGEREEQQ